MRRANDGLFVLTERDDRTVLVQPGLSIPLGTFTHAARSPHAVLASLLSSNLENRNTAFGSGAR